MSQPLNQLSALFELNGRLVVNCFAGVSEELAMQRINPYTNNMFFLLCHMMDARIFLLKELNHPIENPFQEQFDQGQTIDDFDSFPPLEELLSLWGKTSLHLVQILPKVIKEVWQRPSPVAVPIKGDTLLQLSFFLAQHESYHLGQLAFLRKSLGFEAMVYT